MISANHSRKITAQGYLGVSDHWACWAAQQQHSSFLSEILYPLISRTINNCLSPSFENHNTCKSSFKKSWTCSETLKHNSCVTWRRMRVELLWRKPSTVHILPPLGNSKWKNHPNHCCRLCVMGQANGVIVLSLKSRSTQTFDWFKSDQWPFGACLLLSPSAFLSFLAVKMPKYIYKKLAVDKLYYFHVWITIFGATVSA